MINILYISSFNIVVLTESEKNSQLISKFFYSGTASTETTYIYN